MGGRKLKVTVTYAGRSARVYTPWSKKRFPEAAGPIGK